MEKFDLLLAVLRDMQRADILRYFVLAGSWCLDFYRHIYGNPVEIPAARTLDADMVIPRQMPKDKHVSIPQIMEKNSFAVEIDFPSGLYKFLHPDLSFEFLTTPGAKSGEDVYRFKHWALPLKLNVFHGTKDTMVPFEYGKHIAENVPNCTLHAIENEGHLFPYMHLYEIFDFAKKEAGI